MFSGETVEAEKYHRQENKYRRQIQRWGQHDWLEEKNTENWKSESGQNYSNFFSSPVKVNVKTRKNYYSCGCAKLTFSPAPCFCLGKSILNLNFFNLGKSHCKQKGWNKSSVSPRLDFDCESLKYCIIRIVWINLFWSLIFNNDWWIEANDCQCEQLCNNNKVLLLQ